MTANEEILNKYKDADGKVTKMERLLIMIESFTKKDLRQSVNDAAAGFLPYLCKSDTESDFCFADVIVLDSVVSTAEGNSFKLDLFGMLTDVLNSQTGAEASAEDVIVLMQALMCSESDNAYTGDIAHRADLYYDPADKDLAAALKRVNPSYDSIEDIKTQADYDKLLEEYGKIQYKVSGAEIGENYKNVYREEFMKALEKAYCLDLSGFTFEDITGLFGINAGDSGSGPDAQTELTDLLDGAKFAEAAKPDSEIAPMQITDRMLGAIIRELMPQFIDDSYSGYELELRTVKISSDIKADVTHYYVTVKFTLKISAMLDDSMKDYLGGVLPDYIALGVKVDMTNGLAPELRDKAAVECFNEISAAADDNVLNGLTSGDLLDALKRIVPSLDIDGLLSTVSDGLQSVVDNMTAALPSFGFAVSLADSSAYAAELPTMFDLAADLLGLNKGEAGQTVSGEELRSAIDYLVNYEYDGKVNDSADYTAFLKEVQQNYYVKSQLNTFDDVFASLTGDFLYDAFRIYDPMQYSYNGSAPETYAGLMDDERPAVSLTVSVTDDDLLAIMREKIADGNFAAVTDYAELIDAHVTATTLELQIRIRIASMMEEKYVRMIGCEYLYAKLTVNVDDVRETADGGKYYATVLELNGETVGDENYETTMRILAKFGVASFDIGAISLDAGKAAYEVLARFDEAKIDYSMTDGALTFSSFYEYAAKLLNVTGIADAEEMRNAIRMTIAALYPRP